MSQWVLQILEAVIAAIITAALLGYIHRRGVRRRSAALREGKPTSFRAFLRGSAPPYPKGWREGVVTLGVGSPEWQPSWGLRRRAVLLPLSASVVSMRRATGARERFATSPDSIIVAISSGEGDLELGIRDFDFRTAMKALDVGSGGGWRTNVQTSPQIVVVREQNHAP